MLGFGKKVCPIGIDLGSGFLRMAQLGMDRNGSPTLHAAGIEPKPDNIAVGTPVWQHWAVDAIRKLLKQNAFTGRTAIAALPSDELFIDQIRLPKSALAKLEETALPKVQKRLPFPPEEGMIQYIVAEHPDDKSTEAEVLVMAAPRVQVDRHLAIYDKAGLNIRSVSVWPLAMINSYSRFFCRRKNEQDRVVLLMDVGTNHCNIVVCRGPHLLFARAIPTGFAQLQSGEMVERMIAEVDACCRYYEGMPGARPIQRLVFLAGTALDRDVCDKLAEFAQRMQIAAQIGDVLTAVQVDPDQPLPIDRRNSKVDWAMAFGLSLDGSDN
jgi:type IV pilus assembly protein PilM